MAVNSVADLFTSGDAGLLLLIGVIGWFLKKEITAGESHRKECDKFPKALIIEQLNRLAATVDRIEEQQNIYIGRQMERDRDKR